jgi:4'-phosphopantetheinyl transferase
MGLVFKEYVDKDCLLGLWEISEPYEDLLSQAMPCKDDLMTLKSYKNYERKLEWLSVRVLLKYLLNGSFQITYNGNNKPYLYNSGYNISISHSHKLTAIMLSRIRKVGIDLEYMTHRIEAIEHKFISETETIITDPSIRNYHLYIHWCAKEALYKMCDKQDINFKENLNIQSFIPEDKGNLKGYVHTIHTREEIDLSYFKMDNYIVVWCAKHFD